MKVVEASASAQAGKLSSSGSSLTGTGTSVVRVPALRFKTSGLGRSPVLHRHIDLPAAPRYLKLISEYSKSVYSANYTEMRQPAIGLKRCRSGTDPAMNNRGTS